MVLIERYRLPVRLDEGTIFDIETTGLNPDTGACVVCVGLVVGEFLIQRVIESADERIELADFETDLVDPVWCYYAEFERRFYPGLDVRDLMKYRGIGKDTLVVVDERLSLDSVGLGRFVPGLFDRYRMSGDVRFLRDILSHNRNCLIKELMILLYNGFLESEGNGKEL